MFELVKLATAYFEHCIYRGTDTGQLDRLNFTDIKIVAEELQKMKFNRFSS